MFCLKWMWSVAADPGNIICQSWFLDLLGNGIHFLSKEHWWHSDIGDCSQEHSCSTKPHTALSETEQLVVRGFHVPPWLAPSAYQRSWLFCPSWLHTGCKTRFYPSLPSWAQSFPTLVANISSIGGMPLESICFLSNLVKCNKPEMGTLMQPGYNVCCLLTQSTKWSVCK